MRILNFETRLGAKFLKRRWPRCMALIITMLAPLATLAQAPAEAMLLVATPKLHDSFFARSVVLVTRHGRAPPLGVILNRQVLLRETDTSEQKVNFGGPVSPERFSYLFRSETPPAENSPFLKLPDAWHFGIASTPPDGIIKAPGISSSKVYRGFSNWAPGQLEREIARGDWLLQPFDATLILRDDGDTMWRELLARASSRSI